MASSSLPAPSSLPALAIVTGAGAGIVKALTGALLERGFGVVAIDRDARSRRLPPGVRDAAGMAHPALSPEPGSTRAPRPSNSSTHPSMTGER